MAKTRLYMLVEVEVVDNPLAAFPESTSNALRRSLNVGISDFMSTRIVTSLDVVTLDAEVVSKLRKEDAHE